VTTVLVIFCVRGPMLDKDRHQLPDIDFGGRSVSENVGVARNPLGISGATQPACHEWMRTEAASRVQHASDFGLVHIPLTMQSHPILSWKPKGWALMQLETASSRNGRSRCRRADHVDKAKVQSQMTSFCSRSIAPQNTWQI
jgi:hypothetical protein